MTSVKKYFGTDGIRGRVGKAPISADWILKLGWSVGTVIKKHFGTGKVLIGKDTRVSGYMFEAALEAGLSASGIDILLLGPMPTPGIAYLTRTLRAQAGIVISASHNPYYDNGFKFFSSYGLKLSDSLEQEIEVYLEKKIKTVEPRLLGKAKRINDAPGRYIEFCKGTLQNNMDLNGIKITVDCANGATYHIAPNVFHELGSKVESINVTPDGYNINDNCGAVYPENLSQVVKNNNSDIGISLDGDGDRLIIVDETGTILDGDDILYILATWYSKNNLLQDGVVGTLMSNLGLENALKDIGINFFRTNVGDKYIVSALQNKKWNLGGEPSGHIICMDLSSTGDGIISALQILSIMKKTGKRLSELRKPLQKFPQKLINVKVNDKNIIHDEEVKLAVEEIERELGKDGRVLLRASGTEPLIRIMIEGKDKIVTNKLTSQLASFIENYSTVNS